MMSVAQINSPAMDAPPRGAGDRAPRVRVVVIGAGISGLALATGLDRAGAEFIVLEKSRRTGGVIGSFERDGFLFERGPNTILNKAQAVNDLIEAAGLGGAALCSPVRGQARHIWHGGSLHEVPTGPGAFLRTRLLTWRAKLGLLNEMFVPVVPEDEPLATFVARRLGGEVCERAFVPMVQGIWAGDPAAMSTEAAFPLLKKLEREHGSLIRGLMKTMKDAARARRESGSGGPEMLSFPRGLQQLPDALAGRLAGRLRLGAEVRRLERTTDGFSLEYILDGATHEVVAESVVLCTDAPAAATLVREIAPEVAERLAAVHYAPLITVGLGVDSGSLRLPGGFGFLAARGQGVRVLGCIFNSNFIPGRAPAGCVALTVMIGGDLDPGALEMTDDEALDLVRRDLKTVLGWNGTARAVGITRWSAAIPRYGLDHAALGAALREAGAANPGLRFFGNFFGGVALGDRIAGAAELATGLAPPREARAGGSG